MTYRVIILPRAAEDIKANASWWAEHHSVLQAERWFETIYEQLQTLAVLPDRCSLSAENDRFSCEIRDKLLGVGSRATYRAIFTIVDDVVYVLTVRRGDQDAIRSDELDWPASK